MKFHKQKLYALIIAGVGFISLLLPWRTVPFLGSVTNGFSGIAIISLLGVLGIIIASFMGNRAMAYDQDSKKIAMGSMGAVIFGALLTMLTKYNGVKTNTGFGAWLAFLAGVAGLLWLAGIIKLPDNKLPGSPKP